MPAAPTIQLSFPEPDIAQLTLDDPSKGANVLSSGVLAEFAAHLDQLEKRSGLAGLVIRSGKPGSFIAGADLREFVASLDAPKDQIVAMCHRGRRLFERLSKGPFVTVAAIDGVCLGGGAELAIWCDRRIMADDPKAQFGFPEVKLGLYPGWGGTARASRIVGLANAVELVTSGESIDGRAAALMELATDVVPADRIGAAAIALIRAGQQGKQYLEDRGRWRQPIEIDETELTFLGATASALIQQQTKGHYPAPVAALELMLEAASLDLDSACTKEAEGMAELFGSPVNRALINVFFLGDRNKKDTGIARTDIKPRPIKSVSVVGAGIMGRGIAAANLKRNIPVRITDAAAAALDSGIEQTLEEASFDRQTKRPDPKRAVHFASLLHATTSDDELAASDLAIEAVVEIPDVKRAVFARLEPRLGPEAILATNTSTIPITQLSQKLTHPDRFCGIHFFNPVRKMPLVEVIRGERTSDETVATAVAYAKSVGKSPVVVNDGPGFLVNRLLFFYMLEALELLSEGAEIKAIERAAKSFGMPMGPLALYDVVGFDTAVLAGRVMYDAFPDRIVLSPIVGALMKAGRLGQKSGAGFFSYARDKERGEPDPRVVEILAPYLREQDKFTPEQLISRLFLPMLLEATRVLQEGLVRDPRDVDLALIYGIGFPPFKGGLLFWADTVGVERILKMLEPLQSLGPRMAPTGLLLEMAKTGRRFYRPGE
ncbi:MAG TPA: 3-hydroxyacyl-CoA dehydrogenase NAD-binding domain-containing protein [Pirellulales bacterium]|jgi:3-hydroxyacyl-CoA dehydrogenase/enoyl-CoA hydratase/3-hydroxybutyryl-CoA epimerase/3-hydroxyacyl-CoA dehydrogenase/enoyl-CoA hydratase/3-hydroxybutyryl-CoA epimerase/enoyl-CoA isomerase|nr:3-hydroxyacyl-CoA dehydrogenase NAD-binding domain-containing protein [Pirellulales bacterium]